MTDQSNDNINPITGKIRSTAPLFPENVYKAQMLMDQVLKLLRASRDEVNRPAKFGGRELSEAITCFETGCMNMNRSLFAEKPYSPILPRPEVKKEDQWN